ncbi:cytidylate kinase [Anaeroplasma bactoclasticum]|jgi:cytidylate kinase|uniref:Cytidylate kinase n=1 Tax=Anaeroplasma bactoclasticum TaxID=2088 RepID=A0A397RZT5_9MOLU|nr:(d)CMP kinase [Anaeroplasma bactoclasticum]RIA78066.1 cytidylate kinase [Anaeroplasma bactoclasticum]
MKNFVVAIDGPAGSGKSSISKLVCEKLGFTHIDTGAMYRAVTLEALKRKIDVENENEYSFIDEIDVVYKDGKVFLNGEDVSGFIRTSEVTNNASAVSRVKAVRDKMVDFQRGCRNYGNILMDGRDIGTVVFPDADLKVFLTATPEERAKRRCLENKTLGVESDFNTILEEIKARDYKDSHRAIAPLKQADDAILVDTTNMSIDEVCQEILRLIDERLNKNGK